MDMDVLVSDESKKRRLPMWMLGVSAADKVQKSKKGEVNGDVIIENHGTQCGQPKPRARRAAQHEKEASVPCAEALEEEQSSLVVKGETKGRKRKVNGKDVSSSNNDVQEHGFKKRKRGGGGINARKSARGRRRKAESVGLESSEDIEVASSNEGDGDLTMDDLMSIAKEFVQDNKDMGQQQQSDGELIAKGQFAVTDSSKEEPDGSFNAPLDIIRRSSTHKDAAACFSSSSAKKSTSEEILVNPSRTGDPTQDMLDLFLGPLLKKPVEEKKVDFITDVKFTHELSEQTQRVVIADAHVPLTKKKSSLKDKVAMFLD